MSEPPPRRPAGNVPFSAQLAIGFGLAVFAIIIAGGPYLSAYPFGLPILVSAVLTLLTVALAAAIFWHWRGFLAGVLSGIVALALLAVLFYFLLTTLCGGPNAFFG